MAQDSIQKLTQKLKKKSTSNKVNYDDSEKGKSSSIDYIKDTVIFGLKSMKIPNGKVLLGISIVLMNIKQEISTTYLMSQETRKISIYLEAIDRVSERLIYDSHQLHEYTFPMGNAIG